MNRAHHPRAAIVSLVILALLIAAPIAATWRSLRQERLNRALIAAVRRNDDRAVVSLLNLGADANCRDEPPRKFSLWQTVMQVVRGRRSPPSHSPTPLLIALKWREQPGGSPLLDYPPENIALVRSLLDHGARIEERLGEGGETPLMLAVESEKHATIHQLLERGANVDAQTSDHTTALICAMWRSDEETVNALLAHHADVNVRQDPDGTALGIAEFNYETHDDAGVKRIIQALKQAGAKP